MSICYYRIAFTSVVSHYQAYGKEFIKSFLEAGSKYDLSADDFVATATELTAQTVLVNYDLHVRPLLRGTRVILFVSGGGVHNDYLIKYVMVFIMINLGSCNSSIEGKILRINEQKKQRNEGTAKKREAWEVACT